MSVKSVKMDMRFRPGEFVWAKLVGYSYWPAIILNPPQSAPEQPHPDSKWVYFFWSHNYAWVRNKYIKHYDDYKERYTTKCPENILRAHEEVERHRKNKAKDPKYQINFVEFAMKNYKVRPKSAQSQRSVSSMASSRGRRPNSSQSRRSVVSKASNRGKRPKSSQSYKSISSKASSTGRCTSRASSVSSSATSSHRGRNQRFHLKPKNDRRIVKELVGVLICNLYGGAIARNLIGFGHNVVIYSPSIALCKELRWYAKNMGGYFRICETAREVVRHSKIIFNCSSSCQEANDILYSLGVNNENDDLLEGKIFVEMTSLNSEASSMRDILITKKKAAYLEARIEGSVKNAEDRDIILIVGGKDDTPKTLVEKYESCFWALGRGYLIVGKVGSAIIIHGILQTIRATILAGFAEAAALANKCMKLETFFEIFFQSSLSSIYLNGICDTILSEDYLNIQEPIGMLQEDLAQMLETHNKFRQPAPLASTANQLYKHARRLGFDDYDSAAMFLRAK